LKSNKHFIKFFVYLHAEFNSQWPITESARIQTAATGQDERTNKEELTKQGKMDQLGVFYIQT
jgi:hypothetical protein